MQDGFVGAIADRAQKLTLVFIRVLQQGQSLIGMAGEDHLVELMRLTVFVLNRHAL
jgi:hypothetical protein